MEDKQTRDLDFLATQIQTKKEPIRKAFERICAIDKKVICFLMLNPSNADYENDDPTIRRCKDFMFDLGYSGLIVVNLFSLITPNPKVLYDYIGKRKHLEGYNLNDPYIKYAFKISKTVVAAYGVLKYQTLKNRAEKIFKWTKKPIYALRLTKQGFPGHPLYLNKNCKLIPFRNV